MTSEAKYEQYHLLAEDDETTTDSRSSNGTLYVKSSSSIARLSSHIPWLQLVAAVKFLLSITAGFTIGFIYRGNEAKGLPANLNLGFTQPSTLWWNTNFSDLNMSTKELDELWDTHIPWESGIIALKNEEARAMGLPESQPFPWDGKTKSLYIMNAHHLLHCVRNVYISIQQYRSNKTQTVAYEHILHCLDSLRVETMCNADDTLRYVPFNSAHGFRPGDGQPRKCRDWRIVQQFVEAHDPCYRYLKPGDKDLSNLERFKFCPVDSKYLPKIRHYFGYSANWTPGPYEGPRELEW